MPADCAILRVTLGAPTRVCVSRLRSVCLAPLWQGPGPDGMGRASHAPMLRAGLRAAGNGNGKCGSGPSGHGRGVAPISHDASGENPSFRSEGKRRAWFPRPVQTRRAALSGETASAGSANIGATDSRIASPTCTSAHGGPSQFWSLRTWGKAAPCKESNAGKINLQV